MTLKKNIRVKLPAHLHTSAPVR